MATTILITDGEGRSSLAATRSLGRRGCRIIITGSKRNTISAASKYCYKDFAVPDPLQRGADYVKAIAEIANREAVNYIFPMTDHSVFLLNRNREALPENTVLACPDHGKVNHIADKSNLMRIAHELRIPIPNTLFLNGPDDLQHYNDRMPPFPVVIKPAFSKFPVGDKLLSGGVMYASSMSELHNLYATRPSLQYPSIIQEKIYGPGTGLFTIFDKDRHLALFSHRRLKEKPPSGGVSVVSVSVPLDPMMVEYSKRLLSDVDWNGVAMVEFKRDNRDGQPKLIEINGRFWGSLQLAISSGVDFPSLYLDYLEGIPYSKPAADYKIGHQMKWFLGTLDLLIIQIKNRKLASNLPLHYCSGQGNLLELFNIFSKEWSFDVINKNDLKPFAVELKEYFCDILDKK